MYQNSRKIAKIVTNKFSLSKICLFYFFLSHLVDGKIVFVEYEGEEEDKKYLLTVKMNSGEIRFFNFLDTELFKHLKFIPSKRRGDFFELEKQQMVCNLTCCVKAGENDI